MDWIGRILGIGVLIVVVLIAIAGLLYASDYALAATVTKKDCAQNPPTVTVETKTFGIVHAMDVTHDQCALIGVGNYVVYHVRSAHTTIYMAEGGRCVYDTVSMVC